MLKHAIRFLLPWANTLSLLLFLSTTAAAITSHWYDAVYIVRVGSSMCVVGIEGGRIVAGCAPSMRPQQRARIFWNQRSENLSSFLDRAFQSFDGRFGGGSYYLEIPWAWCPLAFALTTAALSFLTLAQRRRRRQRVGACAVCGYDLRATPTQCPECGATGDQLNRKKDNIDRLGELSRKPLARAIVFWSCIAMGLVIWSVCIALFLDMLRSAMRHERSLWAAMQLGAGATVALSLLAVFASVLMFYGSKWRERARRDGGFPGSMSVVLHPLASSEQV